MMHRTMARAGRQALPAVAVSFWNAYEHTSRQGVTMAGSNFGIYRATVLNTVDPNGNGRIQVLVPAISGQASGWANGCVPSGGSTSGIQVGDTAWIMFEQGDPTSPVIIGVMPS